MSKLIKNVHDLRLLAAMNGTVPLTDELCNHIKLGSIKFKDLPGDAIPSMLNHSTGEEFKQSDIKMCTGLTDNNGDDVDVIYCPVSSRDELGLYAILLCLYKDGPMTVGYLYEGGHIVTDSIQYDQKEWLTVDKNWKRIPVSLLNATKLRRHVVNTEVLLNTLKLTGYFIHTTSSRENPTVSDDLLYYNNTPAVNVRTGQTFQNPALASSYDDESDYESDEETVDYVDNVHFDAVSDVTKSTGLDTLIDFFASSIAPLTSGIEEIVKNQDLSIREQKYISNHFEQRANDNHDKLTSLINHTHQETQQTYQAVMRSVMGLEIKINQLLSSSNQAPQNPMNAAIAAHATASGYPGFGPYRSGPALRQTPLNNTSTREAPAGLSPYESNALLNLQRSVAELRNSNITLSRQMEEANHRLNMQDKIIASFNAPSDGVKGSNIKKATNAIDGLLDDYSDK